MRFLLLFFFLSVNLSAFAQNQGYLTNQVLVRFEQKTDVPQFLEDFRASNPITFTYSRNISPYMNIWHLKYDGNIDAKRLVIELWEQAEVDEVQVNHKIKQRITPNDPLYNEQWQWLNTAMDGAWDITTGGVTANGDTIVVAVIDDGIQLDHPDLEANIWHNYAEIPGNGIDDDNNGFIDDFNGWNIDFGNNNVDVGDHGVNCSGMVGAVGNDGNQGVGANWNVKIMTVVGGGGVNQEAEIIEAYSYVLDFRKRYNESNGAEGAFVVATNSSWGSDFTQASEAPLWCAFFDSLGVEGILSCGATSNSAYDVDQEGDLPTACSSDYLISVTATDINDMRNFSAWGLETIDIAAPGDNIYTTNTGGGYISTSGTSFATPLTAGIVGLLYAAPCSDIADLALSDPSAAATLIKSYILDGVDQTEQLKTEIKSGGRLNASKSIQLLLGSCEGCTPPFSITTTEVTDVDANLNFSSFLEETNLTVTWSGGTETYDNITSPFKLENLMSCTDYTLQLQSVCEGDTLSDVVTHSFKTDGCCDLPANFQVSINPQGLVIVEWESVLAAESYTLEYAPEPYSSWTSITSNELSETLSDLTECENYQFRIKTNCDGPDIAFSEPIGIKTFGCGVCLDLDYCPSAGSDNAFEWLEKFSIIDVFENESGPEEDKYEFFSNFDISLTKGETYQFVLEPGFSSSPFDEDVIIWIDYNQDGVFDYEEVILNPDFTIQESTSFEVTIDSDAPSGYTRMRVLMKYPDFVGNDTISPCGEFSYGEVEDYCVTIQEAGYCLGPEELSFEVNSFSANLNWNDVDESISFVVKHRKAGEEEWENATTITSDFQLSNLEKCTDYEVEVQAICMNGIGLKVTDTFKTECANSILTPFGENAFSIRPNPFSDEFEVIIHGATNKQFQVRMFDLLGRNIAITSGLIGEQSLSIKPIDKITDGVYLLQLQTEDHTGVIKIVKAN